MKKYNLGWDNNWDKNPRFRHDITIENIVKMNKDGMILPVIAKYFGVSRYCIMARFKKAGIIPINWRYKKGYYNHSSDTKKKIGASNSPYRKGKTWEEIYGEEKSVELKVGWIEHQKRKFLNGFNPSSSKEARKKISEKAKERCKDPKYLKKILTYVGQNKQEKFMENLLHELGYNFKFVGDGKISIGGKCPDFILGNKIIEYFGSYWHDTCDEDERINFFKDMGYNTLVIWDYELKNLSKLESKIRRFCYAGDQN